MKQLSKQVTQQCLTNILHLLNNINCQNFKMIYQWINKIIQYQIFSQELQRQFLLAKLYGSKYYHRLQLNTSLTSSGSKQIIMEGKRAINIAKIILLSNSIIFLLLILITALLLVLDWSALFQYFWSHLLFTLVIIVVGIIFLIGMAGVFIENTLMIYASWANSMIWTIFSIFSFLTLLQISQQSSCQKSLNYFSWKMQSVDTSADTLFCSYCPCQLTNNTGKAQVQQCPSWVENNYSPILAVLEDNLQCSGWCKQSTTSYYKFTNSLNIKPVQTSSCHAALQRFIFQRNFSFIVPPLLLLLQMGLNSIVMGFYLFMLEKLKNTPKDRTQKQSNLPKLLGIDSKQT